MTLPRPFRNIHPPPAPASLPKTPEDVGCVPACGKYEPRVYACLTCWLVATGDTDA